MCVKPAQLIRCTSPEGMAQHRFIGIQDRKLFQEFLCLPQRIGLTQYEMTANSACRGCNEFNDCLVGDANGIFSDAASKEIRCDLLLFRKPVVEAIN